jgi:hypothetical protein
MAGATSHETYWHVTEIADTRNLARMQSFTVANTTPHRLHWIAEPHLDTHRVVAIQRRHAASGASAVRLVLESRSEPKHQIIQHSLLITLPALR